MGDGMNMTKNLDNSTEKKTVLIDDGRIETREEFLSPDEYIRI